MNVSVFIPHVALQKYVLNLSTIHAILPEGIEEVVTPYPPTPFQSLMFYCNHRISMGKADENTFDKQPLSVLVGPQIRRVNIKIHQQLKAIRVDFLPGGLYRLLGIPMHELCDGGYNALDIFGIEMKAVNDQLQQIEDLHEGKIIVERFLLNQATRLKTYLPFDGALYTLFTRNGAIPIEKIASLSCLSLKQFERKCQERIGMNPKLYARILRFSKAYRMHEAHPECNWTQIAYEAGYFDQMHLIRDFKRFAGVNPSVIEQQLLATPLRMQKDLPC
ncbi:MAG: AraC family transcriptional regulator [Saprospiraceae bacterium]|nr:AraC family transcriptional regulator [Saprospiraceae bacterium]HPG06544.1 helix-turn-helix domain-containing protein [Saprospiraceae bacterium]